MKHFAILRSIPEDMTWTQVDAAAIRNMLYMALTEDDRDLALEPRMLGVRWIRSYWEQGATWGTCLYVARDKESVERWHEVCGVPYAGITEVELEEASLADGDYPRGFHEPPEAAPLLVVETPESGEGRAEGWLRSYRQPDTGWELQLYLARAAGEARKGAMRRVVEVRPEDYGGIP